jgi:hypothetical protein
MPSYYRVYTRFWSDPDMEHCSDDAKLLALYLLTGPHRRLEGLFRLPKAYICGDLGWTAERLAKPFQELLAERSGKPGFIAYDEQAQVVLLRNALKYQAPENTNQVTACLRQLEDLPDTPLTSEFRRLAEQYSERLAKRLPEGFGQPLPHPPSPSPSPALKDLASFTGVGDMPVDNDQTSRAKGREGRTPRQSRPPRTPRHPSDEFVVQRARQIQAESGSDAARAYLRKVSDTYGQMTKEEQLRRLEEIIAQDAAAEAGEQ